MTAALMLQGTGSDVGKSLLVAGLARAYTRRGLRVQPFKPQNMSNNAAVTADGGEIGRAQALQARACGLVPSVHMNPVLLKPQSETGAQVVVQGRVVGNARARDYQDLKATLMPRVMESFAHVSECADLVLVEGAGSAAEMNLRAGDIANMGFACAARLPVVLVADIDRGGVLASIVGTHALLPAAERALLAGYIVNKFRGDVRLFDGAIDIIAARSGLGCLGVVSWFAAAARLPAEDAMSMGESSTHGAARGSAAPIRIAVPRFSRIANFDDLDPLLAESDVEVSFIAAGDPLPGNADLVVLPGSKSTIADLDFLRAQGWDVDLAAHVRRGGSVLGLCAGFQMLGKMVSDPCGVEGAVDERRGLGLLDVETRIGERKRLQACSGVDPDSGQRLDGYEMHMGVTSGAGLAQGMLTIDGSPHGAVSGDGRVMGCYVHGLFAADGFRDAFLRRLRPRSGAGVAYERGVEDTLDALAEHLQQCLDLDGLLACAQRGVSAMAASSSARSTQLPAAAQSAQRLP